MASPFLKDAWGKRKLTYHVAHVVWLEFRGVGFGETPVIQRLEAAVVSERVARFVADHCVDMFFPLGLEALGNV